MIVYTTANSKEDLKGILSLQKANLAAHLGSEEIQTQGFVTVVHTYEQLLKMNKSEKHIIAKDGDRVVGYLLAMTKELRNDIPVLVPMFETFDQTLYKDKFVSAYHYIVVGQVCIDKAYRSRGLLDDCYAAYKKHFASRFSFAITEIAKTNLRSLNAHKRIGFKELKTYRSPDGVEWVIVIWDWQQDN